MVSSAGEEIFDSTDDESSSTFEVENSSNGCSKLKVVDLIKTLSDDLEKLFLNEDCSDVVLNVEGKNIPAHRLVLAMRAKYFYGLLFGGLKESSSEVVELGEDTPFHAFKVVLRYIYSGKITFTSEQKHEDILEILKLSHKYGLEELEIATVNHIVNEFLGPENVLKIHHFNELYKYEKLIEGCENMIIQYAPHILQEREFHSLSAKSVYDLISRDSFTMDEDTIFSSITKWCDMNTNAKEEDRNLVLSAVRLHLMPRNALHNSVRETKLFSSDAILNAIKMQDESKIMDNRCFAKENVNIATSHYGAKVIDGTHIDKHMEGRITKIKSLLSGMNNCKSTKYTYCEKDDTAGIVIELGKISKFNSIRLLPLYFSETSTNPLYDQIIQSPTGYYFAIHVSKDKDQWTKIVENETNANKQNNWQDFTFDSTVAKFIRITGYSMYHMEYRCGPLTERDNTKLDLCLVSVQVFYNR